MRPSMQSLPHIYGNPIRINNYSYSTRVACLQVHHRYTTSHHSFARGVVGGGQKWEQLGILEIPVGDDRAWAGGGCFSALG
jgi:hypothetical protein